ncbi:ATP-binding protein [bacterium]|nr:ATP-binding protein [bacterium]
MIESKDLLMKHVVDTVMSTDDIIDNLLLNPEIRDFVMNNDLTRYQIEEGLIKLMEYDKDTYRNTENLLESKTIKGFVLTLSLIDNKIVSSYMRIKPLSKRSEIKLFNMPKELTEATFEDFQLLSDERKNAYNYARTFVNTFKSENQMKGMYIYGIFRSGKTYLASAIANEIADKGYKVVSVYYPELSQLIKGSFSDDSEETVSKIIDELKICDLLILDDFGGELINQFIRDEVLGVVLNYRMIKNKPLVITSNIPISKLSTAHLRKDNSESEKIKAQRIVERIIETTEEFSITEKYQNRYKEF